MNEIFEKLSFMMVLKSFSLLLKKYGKWLLKILLGTLVM